VSDFWVEIGAESVFITTLIHVMSNGETCELMSGIKCCSGQP